MENIKKFFRNLQHKRTITHERDAKRVVLEEIFNDLYNDRKRIYKINFIRGLVFGAGSALGGTVVIALLVWVLSLFVNFPLVGDVFESAQQTIEQKTDQATE